MYLFRAPNCTYYTRICLPKYLKVRGFPFDIKVSLLTKSRSVATQRNLEVAGALRSLIDSVVPNMQIDEFKLSVDQAIDALRSRFSDGGGQENFDIPVRANTNSITQPKPHLLSESLIDAHDKFIQSKMKESISITTVKQLKQRTRHFIDSVEATCVSELTSAHALFYRDLLLTECRSHKSNKDYLAAASQFMKWCRLTQMIEVNPFDDIKLNKPAGIDSQKARQRWQHTELKQLFRSEQYQSQSQEFKWVTLLQLFQGLRPSEACQLRTADIIQHQGLWCLQISDAGEL